MYSPRLKEAGQRPLADLGVEVMDTPELTKMAEEVRVICSKTQELLFGSHAVYRGFTEQLRAEIHTASPFLDISDPLDRYRKLTKGIASLVERGVGFKSDTVIYPCRGTDISTAVPFCQSSTSGNTIVTIDQDDLFENLRRNDPVVVEDLEEGLKRRLGIGYQSLRDNLGLLGFALEMNLLDVNPKTIQFISREEFEGVSVTHVQFEPRESRPIDLYDFSGVRLSHHFEPNNRRDGYVVSRLLPIIERSQNALLLRKAAMNDAKSTGPFYDLLPGGSAVVSDINEVDTLSWVPSLRWVNLIAINGGLDGRFDDLLTDVGPLAVRNNSLYTKSGFGYLDELRDLRVYTIGGSIEPDPAA